MTPGTASQGAPSEREEIEMLIPWLVTGRISAADRTRVEAFAARHPEVRRQIEIARDEMGETIAGNEAISGPSRAAFDKLMASVAANPKPVPLSAQVGGAASGLIERIGGWLAGLGRPQLASLAGAAALLIAVQAGTIAYMARGTGGSTYETASGPGGGVIPEGTYALVAFKADAPVGDVLKLLSSTGFQIVEGPRSGGYYRIRLAPTRLDQAATEAAIGKLKAATSLVQLALPAPQ